MNFDRLAVLGADGAHIGDVEGFVVDVCARRVNHVVVDSFGSLDLPRFLLPIGHATVAPDRKSLRTDVTPLALRYLPEFEADRFCEFTDEELHAFERNTVIACCPDQPLETISEPTWGFECWGHYRQPEWLSMDRCAPERLHSLAGRMAGAWRSDRMAGAGGTRRAR